MEPRYWPVFDLATGRVAGAELVAPARATAAWAGSVPVLARVAAHAFATGPAAVERWWVSVGLRPGQLTAPTSAGVIRTLLMESGLTPERLVLQVTEAELEHALSSGSVSALGRDGVRFAITDFGVGGLASRSLRSAPVVSAQVSLAGLDPADPADRSLLSSVVAGASAQGIEVLAHEVETDEQLALAVEAGATLAQGYRWGCAGSLSKVVSTWARQSVSE